jgi:hypothetical protein
MAPNAEDLHRAFARHRDRLNEYEERLHRLRVPSGWSAYQLLGHLQTVEASGARSGVRWRGTQLEAMTREVLGRVEGLLERAAAEPPLFLRSSDSPWTDADLTDAGAVREAVDLADRLHRVLWPELLRQTAVCVAALSVRPPDRLDGYGPLQSALEEANRLAELYGPEIFDQDLEKLAADLRPAESPLAAAWAALTSSNYRAARRTLRSLRRAGVRTPTLAAEATAALELPRPGRSWRRSGGRSPTRMRVHCVNPGRPPSRRWSSSSATLPPRLSRRRYPSWRACSRGWPRTPRRPPRFPRCAPMSARSRSSARAPTSKS